MGIADGASVLHPGALRGLDLLRAGHAQGATAAGRLRVTRADGHTSSPSTTQLYKLMVQGKLGGLGSGGRSISVSWTVQSLDLIFVGS